MYDKQLIEWVAVQYHWTLDSSCWNLSHPLDSLKYSTDSLISSDIEWLPIKIRYIYYIIQEENSESSCGLNPVLSSADLEGRLPLVG